MAGTRSYPSDIADDEWAFVCPYLRLMREDAPQREHPLQRQVLGRAATPAAVVFDGRTLQRAPESGHRAGCGGAKKRTGSKAHSAVDTLGHVLSVGITPANERERAQGGGLCRPVQEITGQTVTVGFGDHGYTGEGPEYEAAVHGIDLQVITKPEGQTGFGLLPRRWVVEPSFA